MNALMRYLRGDPARIRARRIIELESEIAQEEEATEAKRKERDDLIAERTEANNPDPERR